MQTEHPVVKVSDLYADLRCLLVRNGWKRVFLQKKKRHHVSISKKVGGQDWSFGTTVTDPYNISLLFAAEMKLVIRVLEAGLPLLDTDNPILRKKGMKDGS